MKKRKWITLIAVFALLLTCIVPAAGVKASAGGQGQEFIRITDNKKLVVEVTPGETTHVKIPVIAMGDIVTDPYAYAEVPVGSPLTIGDVTLTTENGDNDLIFISAGLVTYLEFDITTADDAKINNYDYTLHTSFQANYANNISGFVEYQPATQDFELKARVAKEKAPAQIVVDHVSYKEDAAVIGNNFDLTFDVVNEGEIAALNVYAELDYEGTDMIPGYTVENMKVGDLKAGEKKSIKIPVKILPTASEGMKTVTVNFTYNKLNGDTASAQKKVYITIGKASATSSENAKLTISADDVNHKALVGTDCIISGTVKNVGDETAKEVRVSVTGGIGAETGILLKSETDSVSLSTIESDKTKKFSLPLLITEGASSGLKDITVQVDYKDATGETRTAVCKMYITVTQPVSEQADSDVVITDAVQSPNSPTVGQKVSVTFVLENRGKSPVTEVKVGGDNLSTAGFEPYTAIAQKEIGTLKAGEKKKITLDFKVGAEISEGLNTLDLAYEYKDAAGALQEKTMGIYILNVINDSNSKPKIIVSDFKFDKEELKAGTTFLFTYYLKNTHATKAAKNIKVTISQADNIFSAAQGTNSFYIDKIDPLETVENSLEMRVRGDVTTGAYELSIQVEYEYDDMSKVDIEAGGVTEENKIKLQAVENLRPSIQNLVVGQYGEAAFVNQSSTMCFDFVNMGKSPLSNVRFKLEGDFMLETGDSYFQGTVSPGEATYVELMVIPQMEGQCQGTVDIIFEDSNGDEVTMPYEFSNIMVMGEPVYDDMGMGGDMPSDPTFSEMPQEPVKEPILPVWLFVVINCAVFVVALIVVRQIVIARFKKKQRAQDEEL